MTFTDDDTQAVTAARILALDAVEAAGSGHPGTAIALAPLAHLLFQRHLRHDPADPAWFGRDRFVLSCGHASILLYTQLFLTGYAVSLDALKGFRQHDSLTPGHPEYRHTPGVEMTTGPLGQGFATAVGMAMAIKRQRALHDPDAAAGTSVLDRTVWVIASDGDLQEGISAEAAALAGRHQLDNLVVVYDDNDIQIEGDTALAGAEDTATRFRAQGWNAVEVGLAPSGDLDVPAIDAALSEAVAQSERPTIVVMKSQIAWPAPHAVNTAASHGAPLGAAEAAATRAVLGIDSGPFEVAPAALEVTRRALARGAELHSSWDGRFAAWRSAHPSEAKELDRAQRRELPPLELPAYSPGDTLATRDASGKTIQALAASLPELWGGSADLAEPNRTAIHNGGSFLPETGRTGRNVHFGVREHAMAAIMNGIALIGGSRFFAGTFLVFSDYQRPSIRLAALMRLPAIYLWSHDSLALGADGPTHQPIEHLASLRAIPGFAVVRPADAAETVAAWDAVLRQDGPVGLVLARQPRPVAATPSEQVRRGVARGAYIVHDVENPEVLVIATGSEVSLALDAAARIGESIRLRVVSMPSREWFAAQDEEYRESVLPTALRSRVVVEAATTFGWSDISGPDGVIIGVDEFGLSAPADQALAARGITVERLEAAIRRLASHGTEA